MAKSSSGRYSRFPAVNRNVGIGGVPDADAVLQSAKKVGETPVKIIRRSEMNAPVVEDKGAVESASNDAPADGGEKAKRRTRKRADS